MAIASCLSSTVSNIYTQHSEKLALDSAQHKPLLWLHYVHDTFDVWPHDPQGLKNFLSYFNISRPSTQFTMDIGSDSPILFLDVLVIRKETMLAIKVYRKPTHAG
jgi:hypothetical protein